MATDKAGATIPAFRPDNPEKYGGGRLDDFTATIVTAYLGPFHGKDKSKHFLCGFLDVADLVMADGSERDPMSLHWQAGFFASKFGDGTYPSNDGVTPVGATKDEYRELGEGRLSINEGDEINYRGVTTCGARVRPDSEWAQLLNSLAKAPLDGTDGVWNGWGDDATCLSGLRVHFNLVRREGKPAKNADGTEQERDVLVVTRVVGAGVASTAAPANVATTAAKPATPAVATATATAATNGAMDDIDAKLDMFILGNIAPGTTIKVYNPDKNALGLSQLVMKEFASDAATMRKAVPRVGDAAYHVGKPWTYDAVAKTLTMG